MPLYADPFAGHIEDMDPRGPLSAAGGCTWPTIPAYRYQLISDDATGDWAFLNTDPILLQFDSPQPAHNAAEWILHGDNHYVDSAIAEKFYKQGDNTYRWAFEIEIESLPEAALVFGVIRDVESCNRDIPLPNVWAFDIDRGRTGDTFRMEQIEWDKEAPPG